MTDLPAIILPAIQSFIEGAAEEAMAAIVEYEFESRQLYLRMWWEVGRIILEWHESAEKELGRPLPLQSFCNGVAKLLGRGERTGYLAVQFRQEFPTEQKLEELPFGKATSWRLVVNKVLPGLNAGKSLAEIAEEDRREMAVKQAGGPAILYQGPCILDCDDEGWLARFPCNTGLKAWPGDKAEVTVRRG